ncbi:MAG: NAD(P)/FAD-dependent oxidoreductase [Puniceicoccaceae bacterium]|nr:MAG: NAD(P)/FAD-dependent oxidoreductase [Puniceicoccaceae bacterium]
MVREHYDAVIIGAGMSGLAAAIRLAHFGKSVCLFERHNVPGGLNSFYSFDGRKFDVGLHAMTNWVPPGVRGTPLGKLLRQLRIEREELGLVPQKRSRSVSPAGELVFANDAALLEASVAKAFPDQIDGYRRLVEAVKAFPDTDLSRAETSALPWLEQFIANPGLRDLLLCPLQFYGSARERDIDLGQFVILFKSIYLEGFARPPEGVRRVIRILLDRFRKSGAKRRMKCGVRRIHAENGRVSLLELDSGEEVTADQVFSCAGLAETLALCGGPPPSPVAPGGLSFVETITVLDRPTEALGWGEDTIVFFNHAERFEYASPTEKLVDPRSGVLCLPGNFDYGEEGLEEGWIRVTCLASAAGWEALPEEDYRAAKAAWFPKVQATALSVLPGGERGIPPSCIRATDMFTPKTIRRYTGHFNGAVYGAPEKVKDGRTHLDNLFICGTDQGFLGITGALLSGISMANLHGLKGGVRA